MTEETYRGTSSYEHLEKMLRQTNFYIGLQETTKDQLWGILSEDQIDSYQSVDLKKCYDTNDHQKVCLALSLMRPYQRKKLFVQLKLK